MYICFAELNNTRYRKDFIKIIHVTVKKIYVETLKLLLL